MSQTIFHLEPFQQFLHRAVELNRLHAPDDEVHAVILAQHAAKTQGAVLGDLHPATLDGQAQEARRTLVALHRDFPGGAPVWEQAALLLRGFAGLRPFPAANFETGWDMVAETLGHHGHDLVATRADAGELGNDLWTRLGDAYPHGFGRTDLLRRDETFEWLADWCRHRMAAAPKQPVR